MSPKASDNKVRLDRWLWAARFYKTRSVAAAAVDGGKVQVNGSRAKRSTTVHVGDGVRIRKPPYEFTVTVRALSERRGPATVAHTLYQETVASVRARETLRVQLKQQPHVAYEGRGRPTKKERRRIEQFKRGW